MSLDPIEFEQNNGVHYGRKEPRIRHEEDDAEAIYRHERRMLIKESKKARRSKAISLFLAVIILVVGFVLGAIFFCHTDEIVCEGNEIYSDSEISGLLLEQEYCDNSLYFFLYYNYLNRKSYPFIDDISVKMQSLTKVKVIIAESPACGMVQGSGKNIYFDNQGIVIANSDKVIEGVPVVEGISISKCEVSKELPIEDKELKDNIIKILTQAKSLEIPVSKINVSESGTISMTTGNIEVKLGLQTHISEKMSLTKVLLGEIGDRSGILHMEDYNGSNGTRSFEEN